MKQISTGIYTALVTPFKNNKIDWTSLEQIIEHQITNGVQGLVPCGTTGESPTLSYKEHQKVIDFTVKKANNRVRVMAGTGSNNTMEAIELSRQAEKFGVDYCLIVNPYYNKPSQEGLYQHYKTVAEAVKIPIMIYNIPGRSVVQVEKDTFNRLIQIPNILGVKDAVGDIDHSSWLNINFSKKWTILSGNDTQLLPSLAIGGDGLISVFSNLAPKFLVEMWKFTQKNDLLSAQAIHKKYFSLIELLFVQTNPIPIKEALNLAGLIKSPEVRLPLSALVEKQRQKLKDKLIELNLIN